MLPTPPPLAGMIPTKEAVKAQLIKAQDSVRLLKQLLKLSEDAELVGRIAQPATSTIPTPVARDAR